MDTSKLERLRREIEDLANEEHVSRKDVVAIFQAIINRFNELQKTWEKIRDDRITDSTRAVEGGIASAKAELSAAIRAAETEARRSLDETTQDLLERLGEVRDAIPVIPPAPKIPTPVNLRPIEKTLKELAQEVERIDEQTRSIKIPTLDAESIRNKLESLIGPSKLSIDAIFELQEKLDDIKKMARASSGGAPVIVQSRGAIKLYDLSSQLDGSKTTFALPAFWRVLTVQSTSTPNAFRPNVDYTTDASAMTITFTNQIDAASTLSAGQSLTILYAEP